MFLPLLNHLIPAPITEQAFSTPRLVEKMIRVEQVYLAQMGGEKAWLEGFIPDLPHLIEATGKDGVPVPALVRAMQAFLQEKGRPANLLHQGLTSQDVMDTAFALVWQELNQHFSDRIDELICCLDDIQKRMGDQKIMGRTRMRPALEISFRTRIEAWSNPLLQLKADLSALRQSVEVLSLGGPVGDRRYWNSDLGKNDLGKDADQIARDLATTLGLYQAEQNWHTDRGRVMDYGNWLAKLTGHLGKIGQDIALMSMPEIAEIHLEGGGKSSAMPHKSNPVPAEIMMALARYNAAQLGGLAQALPHEAERSGTSWTLEWLILPSMIGAVEASLNNTEKLLGSIR